MSHHPAVVRAIGTTASCRADPSLARRPILMNGLRLSSSCSRLARVLGAASVGVAMMMASPVMAEPPADPGAGAAQDTAANVAAFFSKVEFSGIVDAYYTYNFN